MVQPHRSSYYLSFFVALLVASDNNKTTSCGCCVEGLQPVSSSSSTNNRRNNNNHNHRNTNNVYYTSSSRSQCSSPRPITSVQTDYTRHRIPVDNPVVEHDYIIAPLVMPLDTSSPDVVRTIRIVSSPPFSIAVEDDQDEDDSCLQHNYPIEAVSSKPMATSHPTPPLSSNKSPPTALVNLGCALAANSGFLNGLALSGALGRAGSIAAVTGTYTNSAIAFSTSFSLQPTAALLAVLATPLCYMLGSMVNGLLNPEGPPPMDEVSSHHLSWMQSSPLMLVGMLVLLANALQQQQVPCATFWVLTFAMGLQNSFSSNLVQGNLLRTSHLSGITSDFGSILGQVVRGHTQHAYKLALFAKLAASFWAGGMVSVLGMRQGGLAASTCCRLSALGSLALWTAWTGPLRRRVQAAIQPHVRRYRATWVFGQYCWNEALAAGERRGQQRQQQRGQHEATARA